MVAKGLRRALAVQAIGMAICAYLLVRFAELSLAAAAALSFAMLLGVYLPFTLATFAICWPRSRDDGPGQTSCLLAACRTIFTEWLAIFALFGRSSHLRTASSPLKAVRGARKSFRSFRPAAAFLALKTSSSPGWGISSPLVLDIVTKRTGLDRSIAELGPG